MWLRCLYTLLGADITLMLLNMVNKSKENYESVLFNLGAILCVVAAIWLEERR